MKKTILVDSKILDTVQRESPALYKYYSNMPFAKLELSDYGTGGFSMLMPKFIFFPLKIGIIKTDTELPQLIKAFQAGWVMGGHDLGAKNNLNSKNPSIALAAYKGFLEAALDYHFYTSETLLDKNNFKVCDGVTYSTITYKDSQCMTAWNLILNSHKSFNKFFVKAMDDWEKHEAGQTH